MKFYKSLYIIIITAAVTIISCRKEYSFEKAAGTLADSIGNCQPFIISGTYQKEVPVSPDSFYVIADVQVTKTGSYTIRTDTVNGFYFTASGKFESLGLYKIKLRAKGTPLKDTISRFTCYFSNSTCNFSIDVVKELNTGNGNNNGDMPLDSWWFIDSANHSYHHGVIDEPSTWFTVSPADGNYLNILGWPSTPLNFTRDTVFIIELFLATPVLDTGIYHIYEGVDGSNAFIYANNGAEPTGPNSYFYYYAGFSYISPDFLVHITDWDPQKKIIKGTFGGVVRRRANHTDYPGDTRKVSGGFHAKLK